MEKTEATIQGNINIAKFLGYVLSEDGYIVDLFDKDGKLKHYYRVEWLNYDSSWDMLMPVIRRINTLGKGFQFSIFKTYVSCTVETGSKYHRDFSFSHAEYITGEQTDIEAAWKLVLKFVIWFVENKIQESLEESK